VNPFLEHHVIGLLVARLDARVVGVQVADEDRVRRRGPALPVRAAALGQLLSLQRTNARVLRLVVERLEVRVDEVNFFVTWSLPLPAVAFASTETQPRVTEPRSRRCYGV